ncbi:MAG: transposase [Candidatus Marinimicrobia bacterium]|nr:transposase [Candidatus Neomarinimicrobiota bacterium]
MINNFSKSKNQRCIFHIIKNISNKVRVKNRISILNAFKKVRKVL